MNKSLLNIRQMKAVLIEWWNDHYYWIVLSPQKPTWPPSVNDFYVSVTTVLGIVEKPWVTRWVGDLGNREAGQRLGEAQDRGSRIHRATYMLDNGGAVAYQAPWNKKQNFTSKELRQLEKRFKEKFVVLSRQEEAVQVWRYQQFLKHTGGRVVASEMTVFSTDPTLKVAGTLDKLIDFPHTVPSYGITPGRWIVDLKSGNEDEVSHGLQLGEYGDMYDKLYPDEPLAGGLILYTASKTRFDIGLPKAKVILKAELKKRAEQFRPHYDVWKINNPAATPEVFQFPKLIVDERLMMKRKRKRK